MQEPIPGAKLRVAVLVASYNRVATTVRGLTTLRQALAGSDIVDARIFLLDDASPDGTADRVKALFPDIHVSHGDGHHYWNGGMRVAHAAARAAGPFDAYLLFNDDVTIDPAPVPDLVRSFVAFNRERPTIMVGMTVSKTGWISYGGLRQPTPLRPLDLRRVPCGPEPTECDTFNGNFVLVPGDVLDRIGFDPGYVHQYGDLDIGLAARRIGVRNLIWPQPIGVCAGNPAATMPAGGLLTRLRLGMGGRNRFSQRVHFILKHSPNRGVAVPLIAVSFVKRLAQLAVGREPVQTES